MPRSAKIDDDIGGDRVMDDEEAARKNSDGAKLDEYARRIAQQQEKIAGLQAACATDCRPLYDEIKKTKDEAAELGFPKKEFALLIKRERKRLELERIDINLDDDQKIRYEEMCQQLDLFREQQAGAAT